jgi:hypothetical protein
MFVGNIEEGERFDGKQIPIAIIKRDFESFMRSFLLETRISFT